MKHNQPKIQSHLELLTLDALQSGTVEDGHLIEVDATGCEVDSLELTVVKLDKCILTSAAFEQLVVRDVIASQSDFSVANVSEGTISRTQFIGCRMTGVDLSRATLRDVTFSGCKLDMANFRFADLRSVRFVDCDLRETDFMSAKLHEVGFESCTLERTAFHQSNCKNVDLRSSDLIDISGWKSLKGVIIDSAQLAANAPYLAHELGIMVRDTSE